MVDEINPNSGMEFMMTFTSGDMSIFQNTTGRNKCIAKFSDKELLLGPLIWSKESGQLHTLTAMA